jgi:hypothetical protein
MEQEIVDFKLFLDYRYTIGMCSRVPTGWLRAFIRRRAISVEACIYFHAHSMSQAGQGEGCDVDWWPGKGPQGFH